MKCRWWRLEWHCWHLRYSLPEVKEGCLEQVKTDNVIQHYECCRCCHTYQSVVDPW